MPLNPINIAYKTLSPCQYLSPHIDIPLARRLAKLAYKQPLIRQYRIPGMTAVRIWYASFQLKFRSALNADIPGAALWMNQITSYKKNVKSTRYEQETFYHTISSFTHARDLGVRFKIQFLMDCQIYAMMTSSNGNISALLSLCAGNSPVTGEFPSQRPVTRSFDLFFDLRLKNRLSKQPRRRRFETPSGPLWRHCNMEEWILHVVYLHYIHSGTCSPRSQKVLPNASQFDHFLASKSCLISFTLSWKTISEALDRLHIQCCFIQVSMCVCACVRAYVRARVLVCII